ncbi:hypothetical protein EST62_03070 [Chlorobaculum sp. 24CR]|uniref:hypothetical protein n=1 Tax=Chlorobaculum sp. 24CR TaxID=2508878 RepID=UPI00100B22F7|nr:hypothetical protein [Chlorobaculum sp. 24CR]RXK88503.1 hypothetical protein EST62_03070 [Chlorobaculum sp. 24CR]
MVSRNYKQFDRIFLILTGGEFRSSGNIKFQIEIAIKIANEHDLNSDLDFDEERHRLAGILSAMRQEPVSVYRGKRYFPYRL